MRVYQCIKTSAKRWQIAYNGELIGNTCTDRTRVQDLCEYLNAGASVEMTETYKVKMNQESVLLIPEH